MSSDCSNCGFKSNEIQSGGAIQSQGCRISLRVEKNVDLSRDVLKTDTCKVVIPEMDLEVGAGIISGRFTTVEGLLSSVKEHLTEQAPFFVGDSSSDDERRTYQGLLRKLDDVLNLSFPCTLVLDDIAGNSYVMSLTAPLDDIRLTKEFYTRTFEQDEELGINDMKVENYVVREKMEPIQEDHEMKKHPSITKL